MSTLSVHDIQGISAYSNTIRIPSNHRLAVEGHLTLPVYTTATFPTSGNNIGDIAFNSSTGQISSWDGSSWSGVNDGSSAQQPADSAAQLYNDGIVTSGKSYRYIKTPNGGVVRVWCDFDTQDAAGNSGWMLCASFQTDHNWSYGGFSQSNEIGPTASGNQISSNFGDYQTRMFRLTIDSNANKALGTSALADWYFDNTAAPKWKEWWAFGPSSINVYSGNNYSPNMLNDSGAAHDRMMLRPFTNAYNLRWQYTANQTHMSLSDCTIDSQSPPYNPDPNGLTANVHCNYWNALTRSGYFFSVYYQMYSNQDITRDGSIGILPNGSFSSNSAAGQDLVNANVHTGIDDNNIGTYIGGSATANMNQGNYSGPSYGSLFWWVK